MASLTAQYPCPLSSSSTSNNNTTQMNSTSEYHHSQGLSGAGGAGSTSELDSATLLAAQQQQQQQQQSYGGEDDTSNAILVTESAATPAADDSAAGVSTSSNPRQCNGFSSDVISVDDLTTKEWHLWYRRSSGDPWIEQNRSRIVPTIRFLTDPAQIILRVDGTAWDSHIVQWRYSFLEGYDNYSFIRISNFPTLQVVKCMTTGAYFMRSNWMILTSFPATFEEMDRLDKTLQGMAETDSWDRFNGDEATIHNHGYTVPEAPQVVMRLAFALPKTTRMRVYLPAQ